MFTLQLLLGNLGNPIKLTSFLIHLWTAVLFQVDSIDDYFAKGAFLVQVTSISKFPFSPGMTPLPGSIPVEFYYRYYCYSN